MAKQFGESRSRKDIHDRYLAHGGSDFATPDTIGNVNTLSDFDTKKAGNFTTGAPPSPENLQYSNNVAFLRNYFKDRTTHHFKNGLEVANATANKDNVSSIENLDEDPVIFGFDFIVNEITSPLYVELPSFFDFANTNGLTEIINRQGIYNDFIEHFELLFLSTRRGSFDTFKGHYLVGVDGLSDLINKSTGLGSDKQFSDFGKDKITLSLREDTHLSGGYLTTLYNTLTYSKINGKQMIPNNLLRFDATIVISEIRNYKKLRRIFSEDVNQEAGQDTREILALAKDSVSRYMYNVYDCQFYFDKHSHAGSVKNTSTEAVDTFDLNFYYKFSTLEMEKFKYDPNGSVSKYLNDGNRVDPEMKFVGEQSDDVNATRRNDLINSDYQEADLDNNYAIYDVPTSNNIVEDMSVTVQNADEISALRSNSFQESLRLQEEARNEKNQETADKINNNSLKKNAENTIGGYASENDGNAETDQESGINGIINRSKDFALKRLRRKRDELINGTLQNIRTSTGLRRINSPINVYDDNLSVFGFVRNELRDFTNDKFTGLLGGIDDLV